MRIRTYETQEIVEYCNVMRTSCTKRVILSAASRIFQPILSNLRNSYVPTVGIHSVKGLSLSLTRSWRDGWTLANWTLKLTEEPSELASLKVHRKRNTSAAAAASVKEMSLPAGRCSRAWQGQ